MYYSVTECNCPINKKKPTNAGHRGIGVSKV